MLMIVYGISAERAFDILIWCSEQKNVKLRQVSEQLSARVRADFALLGGVAFAIRSAAARFVTDDRLNRVVVSTCG